MNFLFILFLIFESKVLGLFDPKLTKDELLHKICNTNSIPTIKMKGKSDDVVKLIFAGDT